MTMRQLNFALIDEADSILIDEARTPLIIGMVDQEDENFKAQCFRWAAEHAPKFSEHEHFTFDFKKKRVQLTVAGRSFLRRLPQNESTSVLPIHELYSYLENAIKVRRDFEVDKHYAIVDGKVVIIDEFTGRPAEGRQWQNGIHQSVEAKEGLEFTPATRQAAAITIQSMFKRYRKISGMTGTAWTSKREFAKVLEKRVVRIPTHRPVKRERMAPRIFRSWQQKIPAIVDESRNFSRIDRAVLIGTRSVETSEQISAALAQARNRTPGSQRENARERSENRRKCRPAGIRHGRNKYGGPRYRYQTARAHPDCRRTACDPERNS